MVKSRPWQEGILRKLYTASIRLPPASMGGRGRSGGVRTVRREFRRKRSPTGSFFEDCSSGGRCVRLPPERAYSLSAASST